MSDNRDRGRSYWPHLIVAVLLLYGVVIFWWLLLGATMPPTKEKGGVDLGDVATWVSGMATFAAVVVAIWLPKHQRRLDEERRQVESFERMRNAAETLAEDCFTANRRAMLLVDHGKYRPPMRFAEATELAAGKNLFGDLPSQARRQVAGVISELQEVNAVLEVMDAEAAERASLADEFRSIAHLAPGLGSPESTISGPRLIMIARAGQRAGEAGLALMDLYGETGARPKKLRHWTQLLADEEARLNELHPR